MYRQVATESRFVIYGLMDPSTGLLRYVGKSSSGMDRPRQHFQKAQLNRPSHKNSWIKSVLAQGEIPSPVLLQCLPDAEILNQAEIHWIRYFRSLGYPLTNGTNGGDGQSSPTDEFRQAMRKHASRTRNRAGTTTSSVARLGMSKGPIVDQHGRRFEAAFLAAVQLGISRAGISLVLAGKRKTIHGLTFRYVEGE